MTRNGRVDRGTHELLADRVRRQAERLLVSPYATATARRDARAVIAGQDMTAALELLRTELGAEEVTR